MQSRTPSLSSTAATVPYFLTTSAHASHTLGIDVGKDTLVCTLIDSQTRKKVWRENVPNHSKDIQSLLRKTPKDACWVVEPTGRYSLDVVKQAQSAGRTVLLAPPRKAKAFLQSIQSRAKTDRIDSEGLALFAISVPLAPYLLKSQAVEHIQQLLSARKGLSDSRMRLMLQASELTYAKDALEPAITALSEQTYRSRSRSSIRKSPSFRVRSRNLLWLKSCSRFLALVR